MAISSCAFPAGVGAGRGGGVFVLSVCVAWLLATVAAAAQPRFDFDTTPGRLSKEVRPTRVALELTLDPQRTDFSGRARIRLEIRRPQDALVLHAHRLKPRRTLLKSGERSIELDCRLDEPTQTWRLTPVDGSPVPAGASWIELDYAGEVQSTGEGLYEARSGGERDARMLATQLQAVFARTVFPAFDEPAFRSVFELTVHAPRGFQVIANMPERPAPPDAAERAPPGWRTHRFAPTPPMPAYLFAVAVGRFGVRHGEAAGIPLRIVTAPGRQALAAEALGLTRDLLPYYTRYFGTPYALPKLDQFAVPSTRGGAMEDWGLISYTEPALLIDPARSGVRARRESAFYIAHEIAHQWFGNLVTAASWDEIWLNEAFAEWVAVKAIDEIRPRWQLGLAQRLPTDEAMRRDAGDATRAIRSGPVSEQTVLDVFDEITYEKGGAVLAMLERWIGPETFRRGLAAYLRERRLSSATAGDLWHHVGAAAGRDVAAVASRWTDQPGFPLVEVASRCVDGRTRVALRQQRFRSVPLAAADADPIWPIPLQITHRGRTSGRLFDQREQVIEFPGCAAQPVRLNVGGDAFHRTLYEPAVRERLRADFAGLPATDQAVLLSDSMALVEAGRIPLREHFALLAALPRAAGPARPLLHAIALGQVERLDRVLSGTDAEPAWRAAARALLAPELARLGWRPRPADSAEAAVLRSDLIAWLARSGDRAVRRRAGRLFDLDQRGRLRLPAEIRAGVTIAAGVDPDLPRFERLQALLRRAGSEEDRQLFGTALASGVDPRHAAQLLAWMFEDVAPPNIRSRFPGRIARWSPHGELAYRHVVAHWDRIADLIGRMGGARHWLLPAAAAGFRTEAQAAQLLEDQRRLAGPDGAAPAAQIAAEIRLRAALWARERDDILHWLPSWRPAGVR